MKYLNIKTFIGLVVVLIFIFGLSSFAFADHRTYHPLVPCGGTGQEPCTQCDFLKLGKNLVDFILLFIVPVAGTLLITIAGFMILLGGANPALISKGKSIFWSVIIGIVIISTSWLIVNFLLKSLAGESDISKDWYKLTCTAEIKTITGIPAEKICAYVSGDDKYACIDGSNDKAKENKCQEVPECKDKNCSPIDPSLCGKDTTTKPPAPSGTEAERNTQLAKQILAASGNITLSTDATCGGNNQARQNIVDMSEGKFPSVCSPECKTAGCAAGGSSGNITVNPKILEGLLELAKEYKFTITSLTTGIHSGGSSHYDGEGVDIVPTPLDPKIWIEVRATLRVFGGAPICEGPGGKDVPSCSPIGSKNVSHIHWTLKRSDTLGAKFSGTCKGTEKGTECLDSFAPICGPTTAACYQSDVNRWNAQISAAISGKQVCSGVDTGKLIKAIISQESNGDPNKTASDGKSYGILQLKPATANQFKSGCTSANIDANWLKSSNNIQTSVCIAVNYLKSLVSSCGCDVRQLAAGYNGGGGNEGACGLSESCASCSACGSDKTRRWECLWDGPDGEHKSCNIDNKQGNYSVTRRYVPKVQYCYGRF